MWDSGDTMPSRRGRGRYAGVSLVEVLIVVSIIVFLLALLVPGLGAARERARRLVCRGNLRQWGVALHLYRNAYNDYFPGEGTHGSGIGKRGTWYNELPPYLGLPPYKDFEGANKAIRELPNMHLWICPSKNLTDAYKSGSGMNQFHYGMNQVLDGMGTVGKPSPDTPDFPEREEHEDDPISARFFEKELYTVFMFDIAWNSPRGSPRDVATMYQRNPVTGGRVGKFHGDYTTVLYLSGEVANCTTDDLVTDHNFQKGKIVWDNRKLYWGYRPPKPK
jgi:hypothetical protein